MVQARPFCIVSSPLFPSPARIPLLVDAGHFSCSINNWHPRSQIVLSFSFGQRCRFSLSPAFFKRLQFFLRTSSAHFRRCEVLGWRSYLRCSLTQALGYVAPSAHCVYSRLNHWPKTSVRPSCCRSMRGSPGFQKSMEDWSVCRHNRTKRANTLCSEVRKSALSPDLWRP